MAYHAFQVVSNDYNREWYSESSTSHIFMKDVDWDDSRQLECNITGEAALVSYQKLLLVLLWEPLLFES